MRLVRYARLVNLGNYENERVELEDTVQPEETFEAAYLRLRLEVHRLAGLSDPLEELSDQIKAATNAAELAARRATAVTAHWRDAVEHFRELRAQLSLQGAEIADLPPRLVPVDMREPDSVSSDEVPF
jgi:hypothetical protein